jgi:hypothetical protein
MQKKSVGEYDEMANLIKSLKEKSVQVLYYIFFLHHDKCIGYPISFNPLAAVTADFYI